MQRKPSVRSGAESDLQCLAENIYFEARASRSTASTPIAEVTLNRTRAEHFPHTELPVVHEMRWDPNRRRLVADFSWTELGALSRMTGRLESGHGGRKRSLRRSA